jgi:large subunit ribosomal protein L3
MLIGRKLGMTRVFTESGESIPVTVIKASPCFIIDRRTGERDGYTAYVMGFGEKKEKRVKKPVLGLCKKAGVPPVEVIREFRVKDTSVFDIGEKIPVSLLQKGDKIDVVGWSKGKGFQGVVKRWGFSGGPGSHGSRFHRAPGSAGAGTFPGRVLKGRKYPGRMGNERVTVRDLEVVTLDEERGLIVVKGAVPGFRNALVLIKIKEDIDVSARKELAKEKAEKRKAEALKEKVEEKVEEAVEEEKVEEKAEATIDEEEKKTKKVKGKTKKAKKKEEAVEEVVEEKKVEEKAEGKAEATIDKKEKKTKGAKGKTKKAEKEEEKVVEAKEEIEEKVEEKEETESDKKDKEVKNEGGNEEKAEKEDRNDKNEEKGDN